MKKLSIIFYILSFWNISCEIPLILRQTLESLDQPKVKEYLNENKLTKDKKISI